MDFLLTWGARSCGPLLESSVPLPGLGPQIPGSGGAQGTCPDCPLKAVAVSLMPSSRTSSSPLFSGPPGSQQASAHPFHYRQERKTLGGRKFVVELDVDSSSCCVMWGSLFDFFYCLIFKTSSGKLRYLLGESTSEFPPLLLSKSSVFMMEN